MFRIVSAVTSLEQHFVALARDPDVYRPVACPHCGIGGLWRHGCYHRKADRDARAGASRNPVPILRFCCQGCRRTCSRLPACIAPRRWYDWAVQQLVLLCLLGAGSLHQASRRCGVDRHTARRWWNWLEARHESFALFLRSRFPQWGRTRDRESFWRTCLGDVSLHEVMAWLDRELIVP
jgi:transposase-like protein